MSTGKVAALIAGILFCIFVGAGITAAGVFFYNQRQEALAKQEAEARQEAAAKQEAIAQQLAFDKEQEVQAKQAAITKMELGWYSANAQQVFLDIHPGGQANSIVLSGLKITDWFGDGPTGRMEDKDVRGFTVHVTIRWTSNLHAGDGVTEFDDSWARNSGAEEFQFVRRADIKSNGLTKENIGNLFIKGAGKLLKFP